MAKLEDEYIIRGMTHKDQSNANANGDTEKRIDDLVEPLRGTGWLLSSFQHQSDSDITQTDLYASYAARFAEVPDTSPLHGDQNTVQSEEAELREFEAEMAAPDNSNPMDDNDLHHFSLALGQSAVGEETLNQSSIPKREERLLNPVELISLVKMTFPHAQPAVDDNGRFVIRGLERRDGEEKGRTNTKMEDMFPFAIAAGESTFRAELIQKHQTVQTLIIHSPRCSNENSPPYIPTQMGPWKVSKERKEHPSRWQMRKRNCSKV